MLKNINPKVRRGLSITAHIIGTLSFLFILYAVLGTWINPSERTVSPNEVARQMETYPERIPKHEIVKSTVKEIKSVPLYGYSYKVSDNMYIVNFSRGEFNVGDKIRFKVVGAVKIGDAYLVNADYE